MSHFKRHFRFGSYALLFLGLLSFSMTTGQPLQAQGPTPSSTSTTSSISGYALSMAGGAAVGAAFGGLLSGKAGTIGKASLIGGGATSALYMYYKGTPPSEPFKYIATYSILGLGVGWSASNSWKGAGVGTLAGFGGATLWLTIRP